MKNIVIGIAIMSMLHISNAVAGTSCTMAVCPEGKIPLVPDDLGCKDAGANLQWRCYYNNSGTLVGPFQFCYNGCKDGYTQTQRQMETVLGCNSISGTNVQYRCVSNASLCGTCESSAWTEIPSIPYATRTQRYCDGATCKSQTQVGCKAGYYGTPTQVNSGCSQCPKLGNVTGTTDGIGATSVTECYVTSGTFCDATGCGTCNGNAYYVN